jgi:hypothetical protein
MQLFLTAFENVPDPRAENTRHALCEVLIIAFLAVLVSVHPRLQHCRLDGGWIRRRRCASPVS